MSNIDTSFETLARYLLQELGIDQNIPREENITKEDIESAKDLFEAYSSLENSCANAEKNPNSAYLALNKAADSLTKAIKEFPEYKFEIYAQLADAYHGFQDVIDAKIMMLERLGLESQSVYQELCQVMQMAGDMEDKYTALARSVPTE